MRNLKNTIGRKLFYRTKNRFTQLEIKLMLGGRGMGRRDSYGVRV